MTGKLTGQGENAFVAGWSADAAARLKLAIKRFGSQERVAVRANISRQSLVEILRFDEVTGRGSRPRYKTLHAICDAININEDDIVDDLESVSFGVPDRSQPMAGDIKVGDEEYSLVRQAKVNASAGPGLFPLSERQSGGVMFSRSWLMQKQISADQAALVKVKGDSMSPTIPDGATVLVQFVPSFEKDGVYVFSRGGEVCVKRVSALQHGDDGRPRSLVITSDNPDYPPEMVQDEALNDLRFAGIVKTVLTDL